MVKINCQIAPEQIIELINDRYYKTFQVELILMVFKAILFNDLFWGYLTISFDNNTVLAKTRNFHSNMYQL